MTIEFKKGKITIDMLDYGIDTEYGKVRQTELFGIPNRGQNCNLLDAIMAPKPVGYASQYTRMESLGAKGARAYTVTFTDKILSMYKEAYLEHEIRILTKKTRGVIDYEFKGEYSDTGRFHLHGLVLVKDVKTLANLNRKYSKYGIYKCKVIDDSPGWAKYCLKAMLEDVKTT